MTPEYRRDSVADHDLDRVLAVIKSRIESDAEDAIGDRAQFRDWLQSLLAAMEKLPLTHPLSRHVGSLYVGANMWDAPVAKCRDFYRRAQAEIWPDLIGVREPPREQAQKWEWWPFGHDVGLKAAGAWVPIEYFNNVPWRTAERLLTHLVA